MFDLPVAQCQGGDEAETNQLKRKRQLNQKEMRTEFLSPFCFVRTTCVSGWPVISRTNQRFTGQATRLRRWF
jgi:hypothetical protein